MESSRQLRSDSVVDVRVQFGAGAADVTPIGGPWLYRMSLRYDADVTAPLASFDDGARTLRLGTQSSGVKASWSGRREGSHLRAELSDRTAMRLTLDLGAARANVELGGLRLRHLAIRSGAAKTFVSVATPNPEALSDVSVEVGAADVTVEHGGNLRASRVSLSVGVGALDYDFAGDWSTDIMADVNVAMGSLTLRVPADAGVRVSTQTFLVDFSSAGLVRHGDDWESPGFADAPRHLRVRAHGAFASLKVIRR